MKKAIKKYFYVVNTTLYYRYKPIGYIGRNEDVHIFCNGKISYFLKKENDIYVLHVVSNNYEDSYYIGKHNLKYARVYASNIIYNHFLSNLKPYKYERTKI